MNRVDPKSLRKEDSDTVWNELTHFKTQSKNLSVEKYVANIMNFLTKTLMNIFDLVVVVGSTDSGGGVRHLLVVHQPAVQSLWLVLSTNPGVTMCCVCVCS